MAIEPETEVLRLGNRDQEVYERMYKPPKGQTSEAFRGSVRNQEEETTSWHRHQPLVGTSEQKKQTQYLKEIRNSARWLVAILTTLLLLSIVYGGLTYYKTFDKPATTPHSTTATVTHKHHHRH